MNFVRTRLLVKKFRYEVIAVAFVIADAHWVDATPLGLPCVKELPFKNVKPELLLDNVTVAEVAALPNVTLAHAPVPK